MSKAQEFKDWFDEFDKRFKVKCNYYPNRSFGTKPKDIDQWIDNLSKTHSKLRERLGGERKEFSLHLAPCDPEFSQYDYTIQDAVNTIIYCIPDYLKTYGLCRDDLLLEHLPKFNNIKTSKHVMGYFERSKSVNQVYKHDVERCLSVIGDYRAKNKTSEHKDVYVVVTTESKAYAMIGTYGCDTHSCFAHGNYNDVKRWNFSIMPNTFVLLMKSISTEDDKPFLQGQKEEETPIYRMLGYMSEDGTILNTCSTSPSGTIPPGYPLGLLKESVKQIGKHILGTENIDTIGYSVILSGSVYSHHPSWSVYNKEKHKEGIKEQKMMCKTCEVDTGK